MVITKHTLSDKKEKNYLQIFLPLLHVYFYLKENLKLIRQFVLLIYFHSMSTFISRKNLELIGLFVLLICFYLLVLKLESL